MHKRFLTNCIHEWPSAIEWCQPNMIWFTWRCFSGSGMRSLVVEPSAGINVLFKYTECDGKHGSNFMFHRDHSSRCTGRTLCWFAPCRCLICWLSENLRKSELSRKFQAIFLVWGDSTFCRTKGRDKINRFYIHLINGGMYVVNIYEINHLRFYVDF